MATFGKNQHLMRQLTDRENATSSRSKRPSAMKHAEMNQGRESAERGHIGFLKYTS